jgi:hypothetical protein
MQMMSREESVDTFLQAMGLQTRRLSQRSVTAEADSKRENNKKTYNMYAQIPVNKSIQNVM